MILVAIKNKYLFIRSPERRNLRAFMTIFQINIKILIFPILSYIIVIDNQ
jgi:hypothetical protein